MARFGSVFSVIIRWVDTEFRRRNGRPSPLEENFSRDGWAFGAGDGGVYDTFHRDEAEALVKAAIGHYNEVQTGTATGDPRPLVFLLVPSSSSAHEEWKAVPWWKRFFESDPAASRPSQVPTNPLDLQAIRDINGQLRAQQDNAPAFTAPVNNGADLADLVAQATPVTQEQVLRRQQIGMTVYGGGGVYEQLRGQMLTLAWDMAHAQPLTPQQSLDIAIAQRNNLVANGGSKSLIRHWNEEIAQTLWLMRRMP